MVAIVIDPSLAALAASGLTGSNFLRISAGQPEEAIVAEPKARHPETPVEDPLLAALAAAEWDDEPLTAEDVAAMAEGKAQIQRGEFVTLDELRRQILGEDAPESAEPR